MGGNKSLQSSTRTREEGDKIKSLFVLVMLFFVTLAASAVSPSEIIQGHPRTISNVIDTANVSSEVMKFMVGLNSPLTKHEIWLITDIGHFTSEQYTPTTEKLGNETGTPASLLDFMTSIPPIPLSVINQTEKNLAVLINASK